MRYVSCCRTGPTGGNDGKLLPPRSRHSYSTLRAWPDELSCRFQMDSELALFIADELYRFEPFMRAALRSFIEVRVKS